MGGIRQTWRSARAAKRFADGGAALAETVDEDLCPIRFQGQWDDPETGVFYNRHRYYDPAVGTYLSVDPVGLDGGDRPNGYVVNPTGWVDPLGLMQTVGRWMSQNEYDAMKASGRVQEGAGGATSVATSRSSSFAKQAKPGSIYVEFRVPRNSLLQGGQSDWRIIVGPSANRLQMRALEKQGGEMLPRFEGLTPPLQSK